MLKSKTIYYTKEKVKQSKMYGSTTYKLAVFMVKAGKLICIGTGEQHSASTPGERGECWLILQEAGLVPKRIGCCDCWEYCNKNEIQFTNIADLEDELFVPLF